jgi:hypothetical protein
MKTRRTRNEQGVALILTLTILAVVLLLLMAFITSMRTERMIAKNYNDMAKARMLADAAVDQAVADIKNATPPPTPAQTWVAVPGAIITAPGLAGNAYRTNFLFTVGSDLVNLNAGLLITGSNSYYNSDVSAAITPGWQNIVAPNALGDNELVGRIAYWTDVEASKVNLNTAKMRDPSAVDASDPADIDLRALESPFFNAGTATINSFWDAHSRPNAPNFQPWFNTLEEIRRGFSPPLDLLDFRSNLFFTTVSTVDTNTDAFGRARIDITQITSEGSTAYADAYSRMRENYWSRLLYPKIVTDTSRDTLLEKYGEYGVRQILANIIEYQNPIEKSVPIGNAILDANDLPRDYSGLKKSPLIADVIVHVATNYTINGTTGFPDLNLHVFVDVRLINIYDKDRGNGYQVLVDPEYIKFTPTGGLETDIAVSEQKKTLAADVSKHSYSLLGAPSGAGFLGTHPPPEWTATVPGTAPVPSYPTLDSVKVKLKRVRLLHTPDTAPTVVDWMSPGDFDKCYPTAMQFLPSALAFVPYISAGATLTSPAFISTGANPNFQPLGMEKLDPRTRTFSGSGSLALANGQASLNVNWVPLNAGSINTSSPNRTWSAATLGVARDSISPNLFNLLADVRYMEPGSEILNPTLRYLGNYREGPIQSLGELAYIHTGYPFRTIRFRPVVPITTGLNGIASPWLDAQAITPGTFGDYNTTLNKQNIERDAVPDWIMLDFFTVGATPTYSGRINVNTRFLGPASGLQPRSVPLQALINATSESNQVAFYNGGNGPGTNVENIAKYIATRTLSSNSLSAYSPYGDSPAYFTPGEVCETRDLEFFKDVVHTTGVYNDRPSKNRRQQLIRRISNLVTARSNTFTIWAMAQSIKKVDQSSLTTFDASKGDLITGEVKVQAIVERYEDGGVVKFRTKYFRYIYE